MIVKKKLTKSEEIVKFNVSFNLVIYPLSLDIIEFIQKSN